ncbi:MAG: hypothetical protein M1591_06040 [Deltaproteobacteria bacterium]|nr:hypothetical protein [Deltaproteobacteria bacterium]
MKTIKIVIVSIAITGIAASIALAAGNAKKGKLLFNDPKLSGATSGMSCNSCHPDGKGLSAAGKKKTGFKNPAGTFSTLPETINHCITMALKGKALKADSREMQDLIAYIRSLKK